MPNFGILGDLLSEFYLITPPANQDCHLNPINSNIGPYGKFIKKCSCLELPAQLELRLV